MFTAFGSFPLVS